VVIAVLCVSLPLKTDISQVLRRVPARKGTVATPAVVNIHRERVIPPYFRVRVASTTWSLAHSSAAPRRPRHIAQQSVSRFSPFSASNDKQGGSFLITGNELSLDAKLGIALFMMINAPCREKVCRVLKDTWTALNMDFLKKKE